MPSRPCWAEISTRAVEDNYRFLKSIAPPNAELLAIVKADAYGHSLSACAPAAVRAGARWLGVTSVDEGIRARTACPDAQILVIGGIFAGQGAAIVEHGLAAVAWESGQLVELENAARRANSPAGSVLVHLEIDTGMSRQGVPAADLKPILAKFTAASPLCLNGIMTHLYASDESNGAATARQLSCLDQAVNHLEAGRPGCSLRPEWLSVGASAALLGNEAGAIAALAARRGLKPMLRPGMALYGVIPRYEPPYDGNEEPATLTRARKALAPVLAWKTRVVSIREIPAGAEIGYNGTFVATEPMRLALLAVGYADGLDRRLGNRFSLLVRGERAPFVGRVSMDQSVLDVTEVPGVEAGDEVVILGNQGNETITAFDHADAAGTIPWEVFTRIGPRVARIEV
jgi:alanine racemase